MMKSRLERRFECNKCRKPFAERTPFDHHKNTCYPPDILPYRCDHPTCEKRFLPAAGLRKHYRIHTGEKPYKCSFCPSSYTTSSDRKKHESIYLEVPKKHACAFTSCGRTFIYTKDQLTHYRRHLGEKPCLRQVQKKICCR